MGLTVAGVGTGGEISGRRRGSALAAQEARRARPESVAADWDPALVPAMVERGVAVHSESVMDALLGDLGA